MCFSSAPAQAAPQAATPAPAPSLPAQEGAVGYRQVVNDATRQQDPTTGNTNTGTRVDRSADSSLYGGSGLVM